MYFLRFTVSQPTIFVLAHVNQCADEVEIVVEDAEIIAEVVEKVAEQVEEIADLLDNKLPEGGNLKNAVDVVENVAKQVVKDANIAQHILTKVFYCALTCTVICT